MADEPGISRGQCAEYCGGAACADVVLRRRAEPRRSSQPGSPARRAGAAAGRARPQRAGEALFLASGCGACHAVRGTAATGRSAPTSPMSAAGIRLPPRTLPNDAGSLRRAGSATTSTSSPRTCMPPYGIFTDARARRPRRLSRRAWNEHRRRPAESTQLPNPAPRPAGELEELQRIWATPQGLADRSPPSTTRSSASSISAPPSCSSCWPACSRF